MWLSEKFSFESWEGRPMTLDHEIGSHPSDCVKKACQTTQHYSETIHGAKLIGLDWICLTTTHILQDILAVLG